MNLLPSNTKLLKKTKFAQLLAYQQANLRKLTESSNRKQDQNKSEFAKTHRRFQSEKTEAKISQKSKQLKYAKLINFYLKNTLNNGSSKPTNKMYRINRTHLEKQNSTNSLPNNSHKRLNHKRTLTLRKISRSSKSSIRKLSNLSIFKDSILNSNFFSSQLQNIHPSHSLETWKLDVHIICKCLQELCAMDTHDKKVNKICYNYFETKNKNLAEIFINMYRKKKSLNDEMVYIAMKNQEKLIERVREAFETIQEKQKHFLGIEITMYRNFLQKKLASKQQQQLKQLQERVKNSIKEIDMKSFAKNLNSNVSTSLQLTSFYPQLQRLQQMYGNRKRFQNLHTSQCNIMNIIHQ